MIVRPAAPASAFQRSTCSSLLAWLRGDPMSCSMVAIPSEAEEDQRRPGRERERLVSERIALENRMQNLLCLHGVSSFKPRLKKAAAQLEALRRFDGEPLPAELLAELRRLLARHQLLSEQLKEIEAAREQVLTEEASDLAAQQIRALVILYGLGLGTATDLAREVFCRSFRDRQALASFIGLTGTPFNSGGSEREQGISKSGNPRIRRLLMQLAPAPRLRRDKLRRGRLWRWRWRASCWWRCGATCRPVWCRRARGPRRRRSRRPSPHEQDGTTEEGTARSRRAVLGGLMPQATA